MSASSAPSDLIDKARHHYVDFLLKDLDGFRKTLTDGAYGLAEQPAERAVAQQRNDTVQVLRRDGAGFMQHLAEQIQLRLNPDKATDSAASALVASLQGQKDLTLVDDATIRREIMVSRVALAIIDRKSTRLNSSHRLTSRMPSSA
jgi:hypothetical protein